MRPSLSEFWLGRRSRLWILGAVAILALVAANAAWLYPTLEELNTNAYLFHKAVALDVRNQLGNFLDRQERALIDAADILSQSKASPGEIVSRLMKENRPFESLSILDSSGQETLKIHRFLLITESDLKNRSSESLFSEIRAGKIYKSAVVISGISEPLVTIAVPLKGESGASAIVAEINLKFLLDVVRGITVGSAGAAYIVDRDGYIIAHPNSSLVFGRINIAGRKLVSRALGGAEADTRDGGLAYQNENKENVFAVALPYAQTGWAVVVENPESDAMASYRRILNVALISFGLEILLILLLIWNYLNLIRTADLFYAERNQREAILNSLYDGVIEYDEKSRIILMNPKAEELLGVKFDELQDQPVSPDLIKDHARPKLRGLVELMYPAFAPYASAAKGIPGTSAKTMEIHLSSPELRLLVTLTNVVDERGNVRGFLKIIHDISREQLISKIKSEFVSIAAHQLRTPLSAIKWTIRLLLDGDAGLLNKEQDNFLKKGYEINERMIKLVNDLLNAARIEEGKFGYDFKDMDLETFLESLVNHYQEAAKSKSLILIFNKKTKNLPRIYADSEKLSLALNNLLDNALKYTPAGGSVTLELGSQGNYALISLSDTGVGIPPAEQQRVFSKFFRASNVIRLETEGTGLGLFIVKNIIKRHGGDINFSSKEGKGSSFMVALPLKKELVPREESPALKEFLETI